MKIEVKRSRTADGHVQHTVFMGDPNTETCEIYHRVIEDGSPIWVQQVDERGNMRSVPQERVDVLEVTLATQHPRFPVCPGQVLPTQDFPKWADTISRM